MIDILDLLELIRHQTLMCILSLDQEKHQNLMTCIFSLNLTIHKISITFTPHTFIFTTLYSLALIQYHGSKLH